MLCKALQGKVVNLMHLNDSHLERVHFIPNFSLAEKIINSRNNLYKIKSENQREVLPTIDAQRNSVNLQKQMKL